MLRGPSSVKALYPPATGDALDAELATDFISAAALFAAAAADFMPLEAMSRKRVMCDCARAYTVDAGRWRALGFRVRG